MAREIENQLSRYLNEKALTSYRVDRFPCGRALLESGCDFDMVFLDIQMAQPDGMETAKLLRQRGGRSLLIFVTVLKECVFDAFAVEAFDYLIKPLDAGRFQQTMDRAIHALRQRTAKTLIIQCGSSREVVPLSQIVYCEVQGRKVYLHLSCGRTIGYYDKLETLERRVDDRFFKCHRSYLVNLAYVRGSRAGEIALLQGEKIPVSRLRERELTQALLRYMKGGGA